MSKELTSFMFKTAILSIGLLIVYGIFNYFNNSFYISIFPYMLLYFIALSIFTYNMMMKAKAKGHSKFINKFILATTLRLFLNLIIIVVYLFLYRKQAVSFVITFLVLYFCYTIFEVISILSEVNSQKVS